MKLELKQVSVKRADRRLLDHVDLVLEAGELLALVGPNGAGKTTLLRTMLGLIIPDGGDVRVGGERLENLSHRERAARMAWLPQNSTRADPLSVLDTVACSRFRFDEAFGVSTREAYKALSRVGATDLAQRSIATLSGGESQRVAVAGLIAQDAPLLLVDEPANHLDPAQQVDLYRLLGELWRAGRSIVCVTHDVNLLRHLGAPERVRVSGVAGGQIKFECRFDAPELPPELGALFGVHMQTLTLGASRVLLPEPLA